MCHSLSNLWNLFFDVLSVLTLLVGQQAGEARHPVICKKLCPVILQCFDAVGWAKERASRL